MEQPQHDMSLVKFQTDLKLVASKQVLVRESDALLDTHIQVNRGDTVMFHA
jgi:hypothetical protein